MKHLYSHARTSTLSLMLVTALSTPSVYAATITADPMAADAATGGDGQCSLREAVLSINAGADAGDCHADVTQPYGTNDTIKLPTGTYKLDITGLDEGWTGTGTVAEPYTVTNTPDATRGDLDIMKSVNIVGDGEDKTIVQWDPNVAAADRDRIFHVYTTATVTVDVSFTGLTVSGGRTTEEFIALGPDDPTSPTNVPTEFYLRRAGGGIAVGPGANVVQIDPGLSGSENSAGRGGSLKPGESDPSGATFSLALSHVKVTGNQAQGDGGGIYIASPMMATNIIVSNNTSTTNGGGIYDEGLTAINDSTLSGNEAEGGGGIFMTGSTTMNFANTTFSGNRAIGGGALSSRSGVTTNMVNSTISGNLATDVGAGFYSNGPGILAFVTIANNISGADSPAAGSGINLFPSGSAKVDLTDVLLSANKKGWDGTADPTDPVYLATLLPSNCGYTGGASGAIVSKGHNLSSDDTCTTELNDTTDINSTDPLLGPLADNGGPTQTHALLTGSPALGKGVAIAGVTVDQRGITRDNPPDIGAYETPTIPAPGPVPGTTSSSSSGGCVYDPNGSSDPVLFSLFGIAVAGVLIRRRRKDISKH